VPYVSLCCDRKRAVLAAVKAAQVEQHAEKLAAESETTDTEGTIETTTEGTKTR
jgi:hypothetical protein